MPVAQRRMQALREMSKLRGKGVDVQPVEIDGRTIARSFWGKGWCTHLESFGDYSNRLPRGRTYVRNGSVCHLDIRKGNVDAVVSGSELYNVTVRIKPLQQEKWKSVTRRCTGKIGSLVELLQGRLSGEIMGVVADRKEGLFPLPGEISYKCDCPDWAGMCKHIAAVMYGIGARLDDRPELLFELRGVDHQELITADAVADAIAGRGSMRTRRRTIAGHALEGVFGVELEQDTDGAGPARMPAKPKTGKKRTAKKSATRNTAKGKTAKKKTAGRGSKRRRPFKPTARSVAALRQKLGMSRSEFARAIGVSPPAVANWEGTTGTLTLRPRSLAGLQRLHERAQEE